MMTGIDMSMHLTHYTTTYTKKRKNKKYASSDAKRKEDDLKASWEALLKKYSPKKVPIGTQRLDSPKRYIDPSRLHADIPSRDSGGYAVRSDKKTYTGDKMIGIAAMHKSNLVPVFQSDAAKDIAAMRRG
jgi:hypothetical protein